MRSFCKIVILECFTETAELLVFSNNHPEASQNMIDYICGVALSYSTADFRNWTVGIGTLLIGLGTLGIAYGAVKTIPDRIKATHKDPDVVKLYQKVVYRMFQEVYASSDGNKLSLPKDLDQLTKLLIKMFPNVGDREAADKILDDLMLDGYFKTVVGNATVMKTSKWDPKTKKPLPPDVENLSSDDS